MTTRSEPVLNTATPVLGVHFAQNYPNLDPGVVTEIADNLARLTVSHIVLPIDPVDVVAHRLGGLAQDWLKAHG